MRKDITLNVIINHKTSTNRENIGLEYLALLIRLGTVTCLLLLHAVRLVLDYQPGHGEIDHFQLDRSLSVGQLVRLVVVAHSCDLIGLQIIVLFFNWFNLK